MDLKYLKHAVFYFLTAVISLILIYYVGYHLFDGFSQSISTVTAEKVVQNQTITLDGYLMRHEQFVYADTSGEVGYLYGDGEKVASGIPIAQIYAASNPEIRVKIMEIDEKISLYEQSGAISGITASTTSVIDRQISRLYLMIRNALNSGDAEYVYRKQNELLILLNQRKILTGSVTSFRPQIAALQAEKDRLTASLSDVTATVTSEISGMFYSHLDGYEEIFSASAVELMSEEEFAAMIKAEPISSSEKTEYGWRIGKIVTSYRWYTACEITQEQTRYFQEGAVYNLLFPYSADAEIPMTLSRIVSSMDTGKAVLVFEATTAPENFNYLRMQTVNIVRKTYEGFRVPAGAVRLVDGVQGVYILEGSYVRFRAIEPLCEDNGYLIVASEDLEPREDGIAWLALYDEIITEGKNMYDGKIVN